MPDLNLTNEKFATACNSYTAGEYTTAIQLCRRLILDAPNFAQSYHMLGLIYLQQQKFTTAINYLIRALVFTDFDPEITYNLAYCYHKNQQRDIALHYYQKVLHYCPEHEAARFNLACVLNELGQNAAAIDEYQQVIVKDHGHLSALYNIAISYQKLHEFTQAIKFYQAILELEYNNANILNNLGLCFRAIGNLDKAYICFLEACQSEPNNAMAYNNLGELCLLEDKLDLAIKFFKIAIKRSGKYKAPWLNLATAYKIQADFTNAIKCYNKILFYYAQEPTAQYFIDVLNKKSSIIKVPEIYLQNLYDNKSNDSAPHMAAKQYYKVPQIFMQLLQKQNISRVNSILELGCGGGLMAEELKNKVNYLQLFGVDLSQNMLALAKKSKLYTELYLDNLENYLSQYNKKYDLILAADVLVYTGCLKNIFQQVAKCMHNKANLLASFEMTTAPTWSVKPTGRFGHNIDYINSLAKDNGLKIISYIITNIKQEHGQYVPGYGVILAKI